MVKALINFKLGGKGRELSRHPIQKLLLEEARLQFKTLSDYARRTGKAEVADRYKRAGAIMDRIAAEKAGSGIGAGSDIAETDVVFRTMKSALPVVFL